MRPSSVLSSGKKSSNGLVTTSGYKGLLYGYIIRHGTAAQSNVEFRDGSATATILWHHSREAQTAVGDVCDTVRFNKPIEFSNGIYLKFAGTGTECYVLYQEFA